MNREGREIALRIPPRTDSISVRTERRNSPTSTSTAFISFKSSSGSPGTINLERMMNDTKTITLTGAGNQKVTYSQLLCMEMEQLQGNLETASIMVQVVMENNRRLRERISDLKRENRTLTLAQSNGKKLQSTNACLRNEEVEKKRYALRSVREKKLSRVVGNGVSRREEAEMTSESFRENRELKLKVAELEIVAIYDGAEKETGSVNLIFGKPKEPNSIQELFKIRFWKDGMSDHQDYNKKCNMW